MTLFQSAPHPALRLATIGLILCVAGAAAPLLASNVVPTVIHQPGSQPGEASPSTSRCENCHGGSYAPAYEPGFNWRGSMMSHATRDPIFWATVDVAEQDFVPNLAVWNTLNQGPAPGTTPPGGVGDLCIRCHTPEGWMGGRSTPTDGSALSPQSDFDGVSCDSCHRMMDSGTAEARRRMTAGQESYWVNAQGALEPFYGSGQYVLDPGNDKRGPFDDATSKSHNPIPSLFHRSGDLCGVCHDVSNPAVGHFAPNHGRLDTAPLPVNFCLITKAACTAHGDPACASCNLNQATCTGTCGGTWDAASSTCDRADSCRTSVAEAYPPYMYGIVERTYSEWKSSRWPSMATGSFLADPNVPPALKTPGGAAEVAAHNAPYNSSTSPTFNPIRTFTCQSCHMKSVTGQGCNKNPEVRTDLPLHDQTGGNTWMPSAMINMSSAGTLVGGSLTADLVTALQSGVGRARTQLGMSIKVDTLSTAPGGLEVRVTNLTGHKFLSGYPEGRRAWINVKWYGAANQLLREFGAYDPGTAHLEESDTRVYAAHPGMSRDWASTLVAVGYDASMPLTFDLAGNTTATLGQLASGSLGAALPTFHFVLNNTMIEDHRIPPYGFNPTEATKRNAMPVPANAYPTLPDGTLQHWDDVVYPIPVGAARAEVQVYYQSTSPEYINYLRRANTTTLRGNDIYQAWINTGMAPPEPLVNSAGSPSPVSWTVPACSGPPASVGNTLAAVPGANSKETLLTWGGSGDATGYILHRWGKKDRTGPEETHELARTSYTETVVPPVGTIWYYEVGSTTACGETLP